MPVVGFWVRTVGKLTRRASRARFSLFPYKEIAERSRDTLCTMSLHFAIWVVPKSTPGEVCITQDLRDLNAATARERHPIPTFEELTDGLAQSTVFTKLDLNKETFRQFELRPDAQSNTVFSTLMGLMRCVRLPMGCTSASGILQRAMDNALSGLEGVKHVHDNIFVYGTTREQHNDHLRSCLS